MIAESSVSMPKLQRVYNGLTENKKTGIVPSICSNKLRWIIEWRSPSLRVCRTTCKTRRVIESSDGLET